MDPGRSVPLRGRRRPRRWRSRCPPRRTRRPAPRSKRLTALRTRDRRGTTGRARRDRRWPSRVALRRRPSRGILRRQGDAPGCRPRRSTSRRSCRTVAPRVSPSFAMVTRELLRDLALIGRDERGVAARRARSSAIRPAVTARPRRRPCRAGRSSALPKLHARDRELARRDHRRHDDGATSRAARAKPSALVAVRPQPHGRATGTARAVATSTATSLADGRTLSDDRDLGRQVRGESRFDVAGQRTRGA